MSKLRRCLAVLAAVLLLAGCDLSGSLNVRAPDQLDVDLTVRYVFSERYPPCDQTAWNGHVPLTFTLTGDDMTLVCHITGTVDPEALRDYLAVVHVGELYRLSFNPLSQAAGTEVPIGAYYGVFDRMDVMVTFPGQVLTSTGSMKGNSTRFTDPTQANQPYGLHATALDHAGPAWWLLAALGGLLTGLGLAAGWGWFRGRTPRADQPEDQSGDEPAADDHAGDRLAADDRVTEEGARADRDGRATGPGSGSKAVDPSRWAPDKE